tara:strand:- start:98 stop:640 length:543 start_codon:yes stop_codon:yes gene_type:complete
MGTYNIYARVFFRKNAMRYTEPAQAQPAPDSTTLFMNQVSGDDVSVFKLKYPTHEQLFDAFLTKISGTLVASPKEIDVKVENGQQAEHAKYVTVFENEIESNWKLSKLDNKIVAYTEDDPFSQADKNVVHEVKRIGYGVYQRGPDVLSHDNRETYDDEVILYSLYEPPIRTAFIDLCTEA